MQDFLMKWLDEVGAVCKTHPAQPEVNHGNQLDVFQRKNLIYYMGKFCCIPESFAFTSQVTWLNGQMMQFEGKAVSVNNKTYMIKPFSQLKGSHLPWNELVNELDTKWKPSFG